MALCEDSLLCNLPGCRSRLSGFAWVTACSHVFCDQHGSGQFSRSPALCPACGTALSGKRDIVRTDLNPPEDYKGMVLSGLRPHTVLEIAGRALAFWGYQIHQERMYQESAYSKAEGRLKQMDKLYTQQLQGKDMEVSNSRSEVSSLKKMLEEYKKKYSEVSEKLMDRNRQYQKLQGFYDSLRLRSMAMVGGGDAPAAVGPAGALYGMPLAGRTSQFVPMENPLREESSEGDFRLRPSFFGSPAPDGPWGFFGFSPGEDRAPHHHQPQGPNPGPSSSFKMKM
ncbi:E3 ubiquitin-protein ligase CCNB1IP1-like isoform X1 [Scyliorhinus canicula]|uniref:E3 ubiquitin-protein ligase CCNB1IP1-like isoform X1 n=1 Tax=Scyliorhinus canicula TaxID=7830 RepID=UPI0018F75A58|nr:E3 ubiquitin-protein ligase CCNB1IP1-like isoform X1 [Scyliorhinus canicula]